jgi:hypothetical protein
LPQAPQSAEQVKEFSPPLHTPSPQTGSGVLEGLGLLTGGTGVNVAVAVDVAVGMAVSVAVAVLVIVTVGVAFDCVMVIVTVARSLLR